MSLARRQNEVFGDGLLKHEPHALHVVTGYNQVPYSAHAPFFRDQKKKASFQRLTVSPITFGVDISEVQARLLPQRNICHRSGDLPRDERAAPPRALVVKQDPIAGVHPIRLPIIDRDPVRVQLRDAIRGARVERRRLTLRRLDDLAIQLGRGRLVESHVLFKAASANGVEQTESPECIDVPGVFSHLEGDFDVRLGAEVIDLGWLDLGNDVHEIGAIA